MEQPLEPGEPPIGSGVELEPLIVSNVHPSPDGFGDVTYASMIPGSIAGAERIVFESRRTGARIRGSFAGGGFDPIPVAASVGDTLDVELVLAGVTEAERYLAVVPDRRAPTLIRVDPAHGEEAVSLSVVPRLVFSEPIASATLTNAGVELSRDGIRVQGRLAPGDPAGLSVTFTPEASLPPSVDFTLVVTRALADLDGDHLEVPGTTAFTTENGYWAATAGVYERETPHEQPDYKSRYVFYDDGSFALQYETRTWGNFAYTGERVGDGATFVLRFDADPFEWVAEATLDGDRLTVKYNLKMLLSDFEDGVYVRTGGGS